MKVTDSYSLAEVASQIGVAAITLKRWLLSGKVPDVSRDRNGWRVFTEEDVRRLRRYVQSERGASGQTGLPRNPTVASVFSGIGGFDLGFEEAGFDITFQCEIQPFCRSVLSRHWPEVPRATDIREVKGTDVPVSDVWVGGFPCQDVSLARMGKRDGLRGRQSGLFYEFARLLGESRPRVVVIENVHGLLSSHKGKDLGIVLGTLAELGYSVGWRTFNSRYFGVPQSRRRVYLVGSYRDHRGPSSILFEPERGPRDSATGRSNGASAVSPFKTVIGDPSKEGPVTQSIAYCLYACSARHTGTDWSRTYVTYPKSGRVRRLTPRECEGVMGFPDAWSMPDSTWTTGDLDSLRYHALGNAVTPQTANWLAKRVRSYLEMVWAEEAMSPAAAG